MIRLPVPLLGLAICALSFSAADARKRHQSGELLQLLSSRPRGMTVDTWREQRREAARELGRLKVRRAVPQLLRIIDKERFDVILEIAIDALGSIGDKRAITPLKKLLNDPSLDGYVRDAVAGALRKLGAEETSPSTPIAPPGGRSDSTGRQRYPAGGRPDDRRDIATRIADQDAMEGDYAKLPPLRPDSLPRDLVARAERLDIIVGAADFRWDGAAETTTGHIGAGARYTAQVERRRLAYSLDGGASVAFRIDDPPQDDSTSWNIDHAAQLTGEARYYPLSRDLPQFFGQVVGGVSYGLNIADPPTALEKRVTFGSSITIGAGPGFGRIYDVGPRLRLKRFARVLRRAGLLAEDIPFDVASELMRLWYSLRNTIGSYAPLGYSLRALNKANLLTRHPDPATIYRLVRILDDPQLLDRQSGMMFRLGYGYARAFLLDADDTDHLTLYGTAQLNLQRGTIRELDAAFRFFWNHVGDPDVYSFNLSGNYNWYMYNRGFDPLGAVGATLSLGLSNQPGSAFDGGGVGYQILGGFSYTRFFDRGSRLVASLQGGAQRRGGLVMLTLEARYGVSVGSYAVAQ